MFVRFGVLGRVGKFEGFGRFDRVGVFAWVGGSGR